MFWFQPEVESNLRLEVSFYNENLSEWEPVVEPVLENRKRRKWDLEIQVISFLICSTLHFSYIVCRLGIDKNKV